VGLTQSAVSAQIQRLETALAAPLFERIGRRVRLNRHGKDTLPVLEQMMALFAQARAGDDQAPPSGAIRLGVIDSVKASLLPSAIVLLHQRLPEVAVRVTPGVSLSLLGLVDAGDLGCALIVKPPFPLPTTLHWHPLWEEHYGVIVPSSMRDLHWRTALTTLPFVRYDRTHDQTAFGGKQVNQFLQQRRVPVREVCALDSLDAIEALVLVLALGGSAVVPVRDPAGLAQRGLAVLPLGRLGFIRPLGIIVREELADDPIALCLIEAVTQAVAARDRAAKSSANRQA